MMHTLLVLDHDRRTRRALRALLSSRYRVFAAPNVFAACRFLGGFDADLVLVNAASREDVALAVLKWLQLHDLQIPTIVLVDVSVWRSAHLFRRWGAEAVLDWPTPFGTLLAQVAAHLTSADPGSAPAAMPRRPPPVVTSVESPEPSALARRIRPSEKVGLKSPQSRGFPRP
ncbi:MAG: hypothetical protein ACE5I3_11685 [Phycisphaerae bacterium]